MFNARREVITFVVIVLSILSVVSIGVTTFIAEKLFEGAFLQNPSTGLLLFSFVCVLATVSLKLSDRPTSAWICTERLRL
jgi:hypothetical protein